MDFDRVEGAAWTCSAQSRAGMAGRGSARGHAAWGMAGRGVQARRGGDPARGGGLRWGAAGIPGPRVSCTIMIMAQLAPLHSPSVRKRYDPSA